MAEKSGVDNHGEAKGKGFNRRDFLKIIGVTGGLAAVGCARDLPEKIVPYVIQPDDTIPGVSAWYAGTCSECAAGCGLMVRTREGRAVKVEGLSAHPISQGALCARGQSTVQGLYDPDRVREPLKRANPLKSGGVGNLEPSKWTDALDAISTAIKQMPSGQNLVLLTKPATGSLRVLVDQFASKFPNCKVAEFDLLSNSVSSQAANAVFGESVQIRPNFSNADFILSIGAGFLETWDSPVEYSKAWSKKRKPMVGHGKVGPMSRHFHVEPRLSLTASNADLWVKNSVGGEYFLLAALLKEYALGSGKSISSPALVRLIEQVDDIEKYRELSGVGSKEFKRILAALKAAKSPLVVVGGSALGGSNALDTAALGHLLNFQLGALANNTGNSTLSVYPSMAVDNPTRYADVAQLIKDMTQKKVGVLVIANVDPLYSLPVASGFEAALANVPKIVTLSHNLDETSTRAHYVLPLAHSLETWWDSEPVPGVYNLSQPVMQPLYQGQSLGDFILALGRSLDLKLTPDEEPDFYSFMKARWRARESREKPNLAVVDFEAIWTKYVADGGAWVGDQSRAAPGNSGPLQRKTIEPTAKFRIALPSSLVPSKELKLVAFPTVLNGDGSKSNRPWMQEVPDPLTTVVWGSWVEAHPDTASGLGAKLGGLKDGDVVRVRTADGEIEAPLLLNKNIALNVLAVPIGQGHRKLGRYAAGVGANVLSVLPGAFVGGSVQFVASVVDVVKSTWDEKLIRTQIGSLAASSGSLSEGARQGKRELVRSKTLSELRSGPENHGDGGHGSGHGSSEHGNAQLYQQMEHPVYRWGMGIDLAACTGCSACVVACYAENNIPVVGRDLVQQGREMSWLRIDRYYEESETNPIQAFQPMLCQHCGNAPCEPVCPVYATYHNEQGLNTMVYNRCVGTRYCSNNCPYKVRRFNWFRYFWPEPLTWQLNPDVTVREVGVMEKCTFCVQRIREATYRAKDLGRPVIDGEVQPACASSCPAEAITFGNMLDQNSLVNALEKSERSYRVLDEAVNTQPAVFYLERVKNDSL